MVDDPLDRLKALAVIASNMRPRGTVLAHYFTMGDALAACESLLNAEHPDHFAARLSDSEMAAVEAIKAAVAKAKGA